MAKGNSTIIYLYCIAAAVTSHTTFVLAGKFYIFFVLFILCLIFCLLPLTVLIYITFRTFVFV